MTSLLFFLISLFSSGIGAISGIGGGVIIKPVLDATGLMSISAISFLSGCTVLSMSIVSLIRGRGNGIRIEMRTSTPLGCGAALGGIAGKLIFDAASAFFPKENTVGAIQAVLLFLITAGVFVYIRMKSRIHTIRVCNLAACFLIGLSLGLISAFLGIGGGPINIAVLYFFFSMDPKTAARNSLYIIFLSQVTSFFSTVLLGKVPQFDWTILALMVLGGVTGGTLGSMISKRLTQQKVELVFSVLLFLIMGVNIFNILKFTVL